MAESGNGEPCLESVTKQLVPDDSSLRVDPCHIDSLDVPWSALEGIADHREGIITVIQYSPKVDRDIPTDGFLPYQLPEGVGPYQISTGGCTRITLEALSGTDSEEPSVRCFDDIASDFGAHASK